MPADGEDAAIQLILNSVSHYTQRCLTFDALLLLSQPILT